MITRIFMKNALVFDRLELFLHKGLNIVSGVSGSGKSVFLESILGLFGFNSQEVELIEASLDLKLDTPLNEEENILRSTKEPKLRYFLNDSQISKKILQDLLGKNLRYLNHKDKTDVSKESLLELVDLSLKDKFLKQKNEFSKKFLEHADLVKQIKSLQKDFLQTQERQFFLENEVAKIQAVSPTKGEYERLLALKKDLSKKERLSEALNSAYEIFEFEKRLSDVFSISGDDVNVSEFFNELRYSFENISSRLEELGDKSPEEILDRVEQLSYLVKRYGSEEEALEFATKTAQELEQMQDFESNLARLEKQQKILENSLQDLAKELSKKRKTAIKPLETKLNEILKTLKIDFVSFSLKDTEMSLSGIDEVEIALKKASLEKMSSGEFNRFRLGVLALKSSMDSNNFGILFFDEIDANVSGQEASVIAKLIKDLSKNYQIIAISHQPQLSSKADHHYLIEKNGARSKVSLLSKDEQTKELARMISGEKITPEAINHAKVLLKEE